MFFVVLLFLSALIGLIPTSAYAGPHPHSRLLRSRDSPFLTAAFLDAHNSVRALHNATDLTWSPVLAERAGAWANNCLFRHTDGVLSDQLYGENIAAATGNFPVSAAIESFVADESSYNPASPTYNHFTQVVWKSTTQLGCAVAKCDGIFDPSLGVATLYVCLYDPVGNVVGQALENVQV